MTKFFRFFSGMAIAVTACIALTPRAEAQTFPDKPITIVVPFPAGSVTDLIVRTVGNELAISLKQPIIIDNRPGAGQVVASSYVSRAAPTGYTLMLTAMPNMTTPSIQKGLPYKGSTDFTTIAHLCSLGVVLGVSPKLPVSNLAEFIALLKANPGKYSYMSGGVGTPTHLFAEMSNQEAGTKSVHIPYKSGTAGMMDILSGEVDYGYVTFGAATRFIAAGKMKSMGTPSLTRDPAYPNIPTFDEQGLKRFEMRLNYLIVGPNGMPLEIVARLNKAINAAINSDAFASQIKSIGGVGVFKPNLTPTQASALMIREDERWAKLVKDQNIALE